MNDVDFRIVNISEGTTELARPLCQVLQRPQFTTATQVLAV